MSNLDLQSCFIFLLTGGVKKFGLSNLCDMITTTTSSMKKGSKVANSNYLEIIVFCK